MKRANKRGAVSASNGPKSNGKPAAKSGPVMSQAEQFRLKVGLAEMLKGGVIMDVMNVEQAEIAQEAGAAAVMAFAVILARRRRRR